MRFEYLLVKGEQTKEKYAKGLIDSVLNRGLVVYLKLRQRLES